MTQLPILDTLGRPARSLRISVTDRCNLRCAYCMPEEEYIWLPRERLLSFEEIDTLVQAFNLAGVDRVRLTGGEPLLRHDLHKLVRLLKQNPRLREVALTTNAIRLPQEAQALARAGLGRVTVSLDTLRPERFRELTRRDDHASVLGGLAALAPAGFEDSKINMVVQAGFNDDELVEMLDFARAGGFELRYIEYMDVGGATRWSGELVVSRESILERLRAAFGEIEPLDGRDSAPAQSFALADGTRFGIIASTTAPFCQACDRSRLTADGQWFLCLYAREGIDLRAPLRQGETIEQLAERIRAGWAQRSDRGAEERLALVGERGALADKAELGENPHLEMHTRGG